VSKTLKIRLIKYLSSAAFVCLLAGYYIGSRDFVNAPLMEKYLMLCDGLTIPGILLIMAGALVWASNTGVLDGLGYSLVFLFRSFIPGMRAKRDERYADYVERKRENRIKGYGFLLISGAVTMAFALVFMFLFYGQYYK
jgi:hypothetical protein